MLRALAGRGFEVRHSITPSDRLEVSPRLNTLDECVYCSMSSASGTTSEHFLRPLRQQNFVIGQR